MYSKLLNEQSLNLSIKSLGSLRLGYRISLCPTHSKTFSNSTLTSVSSRGRLPIIFEVNRIICLFLTKLTSLSSDRERKHPTTNILYLSSSIFLGRNATFIFFRSFSTISLIKTPFSPNTFIFCLPVTVIFSIHCMSRPFIKLSSFLSNCSFMSLSHSSSRTVKVQISSLSITIGLLKRRLILAQ